MRKVLLLLTLSIAIAGIYSCEKDESDTSALCNNGTLDGNETEIDCGGDCDTCPSKATFSCTLNGVGGTQYFVSNNASGQKLNPSIRISGTNAANNNPLNFMFIPTELNVPLPVNASGFNYAGEPYTKAGEDTGHVVLTAHDTLRHIISGTFAFSAQRVTQSFTKCVVNEGRFTNVRYH